MANLLVIASEVKEAPEQGGMVHEFKVPSHRSVTSVWAELMQEPCPSTRNWYAQANRLSVYKAVGGEYILTSRLELQDVERFGSIFKEWVKVSLPLGEGGKPKK